MPRPRKPAVAVDRAALDRLVQEVLKPLTGPKQGAPIEAPSGLPPANPRSRPKTNTPPPPRRPAWSHQALQAATLQCLQHHGVHGVDVTHLRSKQDALLWLRSEIGISPSEVCAFLHIRPTHLKTSECFHRKQSGITLAEWRMKCAAAQQRLRSGRVSASVNRAPERVVVQRPVHKPDLEIEQVVNTMHWAWLRTAYGKRVDRVVTLEEAKQLPAHVVGELELEFALERGAGR